MMAAMSRLVKTSVDGEKPRHNIQARSTHGSTACSLDVKKQALNVALYYSVPIRSSVSDHTPNRQ